MRKSILVLALIMLPLFARADTLPLPTASYDADVTSDIGNRHTAAKINAAGPRLRITAVLPNGPVTLLVDRATNQAHILLPAVNGSMPVDKKMMGGYDLALLNTITLTPEAPDSINGIPAMRYAVNTTLKNGTFAGHVWATPDGAVLSIEGTNTTPTEATPVKIVLFNFQRRPQNPAQFIAPPMPVGLAGLLGAVKPVK